jgi:hypothetical protein
MLLIHIICKVTRVYQGNIYICNDTSNWKLHMKVILYYFAFYKKVQIMKKNYITIYYNIYNTVNLLQRMSLSCKIFGTKCLWFFHCVTLCLQLERRYSLLSNEKEILAQEVVKNKDGHKNITNNEQWEI